MSKKDKGWDYLNSDDVNEDYNSDDGSWGYKNEDGSGSYYGADGSWGYKKSDGSFWYYGADGGWGYKNADGSGAYYGSDNSTTFYDGDEDNDEDDDCNHCGDNSNSTFWAAWLAAMAVDLGIHAVEKITEPAREEARKKEERRQVRNKRLKAFFFNKKNLELEYSTSSFVGKDLTEVLNDLTRSGFNNCKAVSVKDIYVGSNKNVDEVEQVTINGQTQIGQGAMVPYDAEILITYHQKREIEIPFNVREVTKMTYEQVADVLTGIGFTEVNTLPLKDLKTGWIKKVNSVRQVAVVGIENIKKRNEVGV